MGETVWMFWLVMVVAFVLAACWRPARAHWRRRAFSRARHDFHLQRERLEAKFVQLASMDDQRGDDAWEHCFFADDVAYVRSRVSGDLAAFVAVTVGIDAYDPATTGAGNLPMNRRAGTAVFRWGGARWETDGRLMFNLSPFEAIRLHHDDLEMVGQE